MTGYKYLLTSSEIAIPLMIAGYTTGDQVQGLLNFFDAYNYKSEGTGYQASASDSKGTAFIIDLVYQVIMIFTCLIASSAIAFGGIYLGDQSLAALAEEGDQLIEEI